MAKGYIRKTPVIPGKTVGRPKININWDEVGNYAEAGCDGVQIASTLGINEHTLYLGCERDLGILFSEFLRRKRAKGDSAVLTAQFNKALGKNKEADNTMLIWLGKNRPGIKQRENPQEIVINPESIEKLDLITRQVESLQEERKSARIKNSKESKS